VRALHAVVRGFCVSGVDICICMYVYMCIYAGGGELPSTSTHKTPSENVCVCARGKEKLSPSTPW
jgi:hypothetical protein